MYRGRKSFAQRVFKASVLTVAAVAKMGNQKQSRMIDPQGNFRVSWDLTLGALILFSVIVVPLRLGFNLEVAIGTTMFWIDCFIDSFFAVDICLNFVTGFYDENELLITDQKAIAVNYVKSWFVIDVASTIPIDLFVTLILGSGASTGLKTLKLLRLARLLKLARLKKLAKIVGQVEELGANASVMRLLKLLFFIMFAAHLLSCCWYALQAQENADENWLTAYSMEGEGVATLYISSIYWCMATMTGVGYGDVVAVTNNERLYSILTQLIGAAVFGFLIGNISTLLDTMDVRAATHKRKMTLLKDYMHERKLSKDLQDRLKAYYSYYLQHKSVYDERMILANLSPNLRNKVVLQSNRDLVNSLHLFAGMPATFVSATVMELKPFFAVSGEEVAAEGEVGQEMYFLYQGTVELLKSIDGVQTLLGLMHDGYHFGESSLLSQKPRANSVVAGTFCDLYALSRESLDHLIASFPKARRRILEISASRARMLSEAASSTGASDSLQSPPKSSMKVNRSVRASIMVNDDICSMQEAYHLLPRRDDGEQARFKTRRMRRKLGSSSISSAHEGSVRAGASLGGISGEGNSGASENGGAVQSGDDGGADDGEPSTGAPPGESEFGEVTRDSEGGSSRPMIPLRMTYLGDKPPEGVSADSALSKLRKEMSAGSGNADREHRDSRDRQESLDAAVHNAALATIPSATRSSGLSMSLEVLDQRYEEVEETEQDLLRRGILAPAGWFRARWDILIAILILYSVWMVPYRLGYSKAVEDGWLYDLEWFVDVCFISDIFINFRTAFEDGAVVNTIPLKITSNYLRTWFTLDFISTVPFDKIFQAIPQMAGNGAVFAILRLAKVLRLARLLKLMRLSKFITILEDDLQINAAFIRLVKLFVEVAFIAHLMSCGWYFVSNDAHNATVCEGASSGCGWFIKYDMDGSTWETQYIASLYWSFTTMTTVGYGDVLAGSDAERVFAVFMMLVGVTVFGYIVGSMASLVAKINQRGQRHKEKIDELKDYLREQKLSKELQVRVRKYYEHYLSRKSAYDEEALLSEMSLKLQREVLLHNNKEIVRKVRFFYKQSDHFVSYVMQKLAMQFFLPGDTIFREGETGAEMFFLVKGRAEVIDGRKHTVFRGLDEGCHFGEIGMLATSWRTASVRVIVQMTVLVLARTHIKEMHERYPIVGDKVFDMIKSTADDLNKGRFKFSTPEVEAAAVNAVTSVTQKAKRGAGGSAEFIANLQNAMNESMATGGEGEPGGDGGAQGEETVVQGEFGSWEEDELDDDGSEEMNGLRSGIGLHPSFPRATSVVLPGAPLEGNSDEEE